MLHDCQPSASRRRSAAGEAQENPPARGEILRKTRAGLPAAKQFAGKFFVTTLPAPITLLRPIETPGRIMDWAPIHT